MSAAKVNAFVKAFMDKAKDNMDEKAYEAILALWEGKDNQEELVHTFKATKGKKRKSKIKDKNAPKRGSSAYIFFCKDHRASAKKKLGHGASLGEVGKELGRLWNEAKASGEVGKYNSQAAEDKKRYLAEMEAYVPPSEEELEAMAPKKRKKKRKSGSSGKKRGKSAYMFFCAEERAAIKADRPELSPKEVMVELGRRWKEAKKGNISKWEKLAKTSKEEAAKANSSGDELVVETEASSSGDEDELVEETKTKAKPKAKAKPTKPLWKSKLDKKSGKTFYYNTKTRKTQWEKPDEMDEEPHVPKEESSTKKSSTKKSSTKKKRVYAFAFWKKQHKDDVAKETGLSGTDLTKELSKRWKDLSIVEKQRVKEAAKEAAE